MLAVVKTPRTDVRIRGHIPEALLEVLFAEYGKRVQLTREADDELVDVFQTEWYLRTKRSMTPGTYLKIYRENRGITQTELGKALGGVPRQHISNMENGIRPISKKTALRLAAIFKVSVSRFIA
jgi:DNA-binding XRE family transcriptional regulator